MPWGHTWFLACCGKGKISNVWCSHQKYAVNTRIIRISSTVKINVWLNWQFTVESTNSGSMAIQWKYKYVLVKYTFFDFLVAMIKKLKTNVWWILIFYLNRHVHNTIILALINIILMLYFSFLLFKDQCVFHAYISIQTSQNPFATYGKCLLCWTAKL